ACCVFFFQAEDGIRDFHVTGVQTCALPISAIASAAAAVRPIQPKPAKNPSGILASPLIRWKRRRRGPPDADDEDLTAGGRLAFRSEERRVGKGGRCGGTRSA